MSPLLNLVKRFFLHEPQVYGAYDFVEGADLSAFVKTQIAAGDAAIQVAPNGILRLTGAATTDNSGAQIQIASAPIKLKAKSVAEFGFRHSISSTLVEWLAGFAIVDTTVIGSFPTAGVWLYKPENSTEVRLVVMHNGVASTRVVGNLEAADGFHRWGFEVRSEADSTRASVVVYKDSNAVFYADGTNFDLFTDMPNDVNLTPTYAMQSGSAVGTQYTDLDYLKFGATRN